MAVGSILGINDPPEPEPDLTKVCTVDGCAGLMHFHDRRETANAPHTLEWAWSATWVCARDPRHFEVISDEQCRVLRNLLRSRLQD